jgi:hypothetical protein
MKMFSAFSPLNGGRADTYGYPVEYPYDLDGSLDFMRPATGVTLFPFPGVIGHVEGLCPQYDDMQRAVSSVQFNSSVLNILNMSTDQQAIVFPDIMGGLRKVTG